MNRITRAKDALQRFVEWRAQGRIIQGNWHTEDDEGRELACALGMLGKDMSNPRDCPSSVMPLWLAECVPTLFDAGTLSGALEWGQRFYTALARLDGKVPESVRTDWLCDHVWPMAKSALRGEWVEKIGPLIDERIAAERSGDTDRIMAARVAAAAADAHAAAAATVYAEVAATAAAAAAADADAYAAAAAAAYAHAAAAAATDAYAATDAAAKLKLRDALVMLMERAT